MAHDEKIVAVALLTESEVTGVGALLRNVVPLGDASDFADLLAQIDDAEAKAEREKQVQT